MASAWLGILNIKKLVITQKIVTFLLRKKFYLLKFRFKLEISLMEKFGDLQYTYEERKNFEGKREILKLL